MFKLNFPLPNVPAFFDSNRPVVPSQILLSSVLVSDRVVSLIENLNAFLHLSEERARDLYHMRTVLFVPLEWLNGNDLSQQLTFQLPARRLTALLKFIARIYQVAKNSLTSSGAKFHLELLPEDILATIVQFLDGISFLNMFKVCKSFATLDENALSPLVVGKYIDEMVGKSNPLSARELIAIVKKCGLYVTRLELAYLSCLLKPEHLFHLIVACPNLESLDLSGCQLNDDYLNMLKSCSKLRHLSLFGVRSINFDLLKSVFEQTPDFQHLKLWCPEILGGIPSDLSLSNLQILDLSQLQIVNRDLEFLRNCPQLRVLLLSKCTKLTSLDNIRGCELLTELDISSCRGLEDVRSSLYPARITTLVLDALSNLKNLVKLDLSNTKMKNLSPISQCIKLETLFLRNRFFLRNTDLEILKFLPNLSELNLENCPNIKHPVLSFKLKSKLQPSFFNGFVP